MSTATKKKTTKKAAKSKGAKKGGIFDIKKAAKKDGSTAKKKPEMPVSALPTDADGNDYSLAEKLNMVAAAEAIEAAAKRKVAEYREDLHAYLLRDYADTFGKEGTRPDSRKWTGDRSIVSYVMNSAMTFSTEKMEAVLDALGIDLEPHLEFGGFTVDFAALSKNKKWMEAFEEFAGKVGDDVVGQKLKFKKGFFDKLADVCAAPNENTGERILQFMQIIPPRPNLKNVRHSDKEESLFDVVKDMEG